MNTMQDMSAQGALAVVQSPLLCKEKFVQANDKGSTKTGAGADMAL